MQFGKLFKILWNSHRSRQCAKRYCDTSLSITISIRPVVMTPCALVYGYQLFDPEDGGSIFLHNDGIHLQV
jgi:hypothetical protein